MGGREVAVVEVQTVLLCFEAEALVEEHCRVVNRHVQCHVLPQAGLDEVIQHQSPKPRPRELRVGQEEGDICLSHFHIRCHEGTAHHQLAVQGNTREIGAVEAVRYIDGPEEVSQETIAGRHMATLQIAQIEGVRGVVGVVRLWVCPHIMTHNVLEETYL